MVASTARCARFERIVEMPIDVRSHSLLPFPAAAQGLVDGLAIDGHEFKVHSATGDAHAQVGKNQFADKRRMTSSRPMPIHTSAACSCSHRCSVKQDWSDQALTCIRTNGNKTQLMQRLPIELRIAVTIKVFFDRESRVTLLG